MRTATLTSCGLLVLALTACRDDPPGPTPPVAMSSTPEPTTTLPTSAARDTSTAKITAPAQGGTVQQCAILTGTSVLAPGKSLVTAMQNTDNGDPTLYFEPVSNWEVPSQLANWSAKQYFGSGESSVGQQFAIEVFSLDAAAIDAGFKSNKPTWVSKEPPAGSTMVARVEVKRVSGKGPVACQ
jgi:hypothetical protein